jgi:hypothetical protein
MIQAVVILHAVGSHNLNGGFRMGSVPGQQLFSFESYEAREEFCKSPACFWYQFVEDMEFSSSGGAIGQPRRQNVGVRDKYAGWVKGGAWEAAETERTYEAKGLDADERGDIW